MTLRPTFHIIAQESHDLSTSLWLKVILDYSRVMISEDDSDSMKSKNEEDLHNYTRRK